MDNRIYESVTNKIIQALESGVVPWRKPWRQAIPQNISGRHYTGINRLLLELTTYRYPYFMTFKQLKEHGGYVKKGEKSHLIVFWNIINANIKDDDGNNSIKKIPVLRYYNVFNIEQTTLPVTVVKNAVQVSKDEQSDYDEPIQKAKELVESFKNVPPIEYNWGKACYIPTLDKIMLPHEHLFSSEEEYFCTEFHELVHATGHPSRLNRKGIQSINFGSEYSQEELVAEIGACFLSQHCGIENTFGNSTAYIQSWIYALKDDPKMIVHAAGQAQKAVDFLMHEGTA